MKRFTSLSILLAFLFASFSYAKNLKKHWPSKQTIYFSADENVKVELIPYPNVPDLLEEVEPNSYEPRMFLRKVSFCTKSDSNSSWECVSSSDNTQRYFDFSSIFKDIARSQNNKGHFAAGTAVVLVVGLGLAGGWFFAAGAQAAIATYTGTTMALTLSSSQIMAANAIVFGSAVLGEYHTRQNATQVKDQVHNSFRSLNPLTYYAMGNAFDKLSANSDASVMSLKNVYPSDFIEQMSNRIENDVVDSLDYVKISEPGFDEIWVQKDHSNEVIGEIYNAFKTDGAQIVRVNDNFYSLSCDELRRDAHLKFCGPFPYKE